MTEEKVTWKTCQKCGYLQHLDHHRCLNCNNADFKEIDGQGPLELITYTILRAPPKEFVGQEPYALGIAKFENGIKILGQLTTKENLSIGMQLKLVASKLCDNLDGQPVNGYKLAPL
ncbi:MAG: Zn-ribbon domain-containing OB-fold protein [Candidatus Helarchaeota archaeon]